MPARKLKQVRRVRWCVGYVVRPLKVSPMSWLVVLPLHRTSTFLRGSARPRPCRLSATLVLATETEDCTGRTIRKHSGMDIPLFAKKLEPTEQMLGLSTTSESELSRWR